jgi:hypothetical protein
VLQLCILFAPFNGCYRDSGEAHPRSQFILRKVFCPSRLAKLGSESKIDRIDPIWPVYFCALHALIFPDRKNLSSYNDKTSVLPTKQAVFLLLLDIFGRYQDHAGMNHLEITVLFGELGWQWRYRPAATGRYRSGKPAVHPATSCKKRYCGHNTRPSF